METMWVYVCQTDWVTPKGELGGGQALKEGSCLVSCLSLCFTNPQTYTHTHNPTFTHSHTECAFVFDFDPSLLSTSKKSTVSRSNAVYS